MKILNYQDEVLSVQFNTKYIWEYAPVTKEMYKTLLDNKETQEKIFINMIRYNFLIGSIKEVNNELKR